MDDADIGTDVIDATDSLSVEDISIDESIDDSSSIEENVDLSAEDSSVDDDLKSNLIEENVDLSAEDSSVDDNLKSDIIEENVDLSADDSYVDNDLNDYEFIDSDKLSNNEKSLIPSIYIVNTSNVCDYFNDDGTMKKGNGNIYIFIGDFYLGRYPFYTFIINKRSSLSMINATFYGFSFNFTASRSTLTGGNFYNSWDMGYNQNLMVITGNNVSISNANFVVSPTHDSDYICFDVKNANNVTIKNNMITYDIMNLLYQEYFHYVIRGVNSNNITLLNNTINATLPFKSINYNVTSFPTIDTDRVAGIALESCHGFKILNNSISVFGKAYSTYYPTLDTIIIVKSNNGTISNNIINETDTNYYTNANYLYGIDLYELTNVTISNNNVTMSSVGGQVNPQGAGAAYPIQITGPVSDIFIHDNNLTTENNGPNIGIYSQNYYGPTNITIYNNFINVTGRATTNYYALVSGIELQDTDVTVYNNTVYTQNLNDYNSTYNVFGISYYQTTNDVHTFNISDNTVRTNGHYAVYLTSSDNSSVIHNFLKSYDLCCDNAVYAPGANITNNYCCCTNCNCTTTNCYCDANRGSSDNKNKKHSVLGAIDDEILADEPQIIELYVGPNEEDGDGTIENPYANLFLAWGEGISNLDIDSPTNIIIKFLDGDYSFKEEDFEIIDEREYDVSDWNMFILNNNMNILLQAINDNSVNFFFEEGSALPLDFYNSECSGIKLTGINIFLDEESISLPGHFYFAGDGKVIYEKCIFFVDSTFYLGDESNEMDFIDCIFDGKGEGYLNFGDAYNLDLISINYATFYNLSGPSFNHIVDISGIINANYNWWGSNNPVSNENVNATIYAIYNTTANYIGDNQWEVIGKLTWNDDTTDGIERLYDMPVALSSTTGTFNETNPTLKDGTFKVTYTSDSINHEINALCGKENQTLSFMKNIDLGVSANDITYGEYANVTVTVSTPGDAMLNVTVNGAIYTVNADASVVVPITELLDVGNYTVDVVLYDAENIYATNSTSFEVKPVPTPSNDTNGSNSTPAKVATKLTAPKVTATYNVAKKLVITLKDANGKALANKKVSIKVGSISKTLKTNAKGQVSLNVATLVPKTYTATVKFAGDSSYKASTLKPKVVVKKAKPKLAAKAKTFKVKTKVKKVTATFKNNKGKAIKKVKLTLKVGKKTYKATTNSKGVATFKIKKLTKKGKYTGTVKFAGSKYYKAISKKVKITVKK